MDVAEAYEVNSPNLKQKMLIATQGSKFKDSIVSEIIEQYKSDFHLHKSNRYFYFGKYQYVRLRCDSLDTYLGNR